MTDAMQQYDGGGVIARPQQAGGELATAAVAAQMTALVQAQYTVAMARPRNMDGVRQRLLADCRRPEFAEASIYRKPVGGSTIEGLSIRFAERARTALGNVRSSRMTLFDAADVRVIRVTVIDLESNCTEEREVTIPKTVERRKLGKGQQPLATRTNSYGDTVYLVRATDDDLAVREGALAAKAERECTLKLLPPDIKAEAMAACRATMTSGVAADPNAARKRLTDAFASVGVMPEDLVEYLGHGLEKLTPSQVVDLRALHAALRDGETTWVDVMRRDDDAPTPAVSETKTSKVLGALRSRRTGGEPLALEPEGPVDGGTK